MPHTTHDAADLIDRLVTFLDRYYAEDIGQLLQRYPSEQRSLTIQYHDLFRFDPDIADDLREHPRRMQEYFDEALDQYDAPVEMDLSDATVRVADVPDERTYSVGAYRSNDIGRYIGVSGQIAKRTEVRPKPVTLAFECGRCGNLSEIPQTDTDGVQEPHECSGCERQGPFQINYEQSEFVDHQLVRLQRPPEETKGGDGATVDVHFEGDIVGTFQPGDRVDVAGVMSIEEPSGDQVAFEPYIDGHAATVEETDYADIDVSDYEDEIREYASGEYGDPYDLLVESIAPTIEGMAEIKEALVLQMFGGVRVEYPDGSADRGDPHILLLGDPGTAKSSLLEQVEAKAPRSTFASGKGATAAGMTAAAVRDEFGAQEWTLDAGALVLADKGIACVDEIDKVKEEAVESMHEALSKQRVHINKGGINAKLPARTAMLAAGNPAKGRFDPHDPIAEQIDLGPTMLSRFDLLFMIDDSPDAERDREIVDGMIESRATASAYTADPKAVNDDELSAIKPEVRTDLYRSWIALAKQECTPRIVSEDVKEQLRDSFTNLRLTNGEDEDAPIPVTFRRLEGLQRLAEASARVRLSDTVEMCDIDRARRLVGRSMQDVGMDPETGQLDADIVETGQSQSQKERLKAVKELVNSIAMDSSGGAPLEEVVETAVDNGFQAIKVRHTVEKLKEKGELYEPKQDHLRTT